MIFKFRAKGYKDEKLKPVPCPLCGKLIIGLDAVGMARLFRKHIMRCPQYRAMTACASIMQGLRVPRYGHQVLQNVKMSVDPAADRETTNG